MRPCEAARSWAPLAAPAPEHGFTGPTIQRNRYSVFQKQPGGHHRLQFYTSISPATAPGQGSALRLGPHPPPIFLLPRRGLTRFSGCFLEAVVRFVSAQWKLKNPRRQGAVSNGMKRTWMTLSQTNQNEKRSTSPRHRTTQWLMKTKGLFHHYN